MCHPVDPRSLTSLKNHNEILRSFAFASRSYSDRAVSFLLEKLSQPNERSKLGALAVLRHLINTAAPQLQDKHQLIVSGLKLVLHDPSNKVKKSLAQTISAMAHRGYLQGDGGNLMIEFIVRQCSTQPADEQVRIIAFLIRNVYTKCGDIA